MTRPRGFFRSTRIVEVALGPNVPWAYHEAGCVCRAHSKGDKPGDLPVLQSTA